MKTYRPVRAVLSEVHRLLTSKAPAHSSPLEDVADVLSDARHYTWVGIYLTFDSKTTQNLAGGEELTRFASPDSCAKMLFSMKMAAREIGVLAVETHHEFGFGRDDRVMLENVAEELARFLSGPGKYLARRARDAQRRVESVPARGPQSEKARATSAAVGEW
ncbi:MAG TPA: hypothetical protein VFA89_00995 [Terriglobales bacterium]|jgi:putative methionine-R-sulfoxide reductase with GAF domain|nr:hypothetical protein [Terriglobales bacterium]